MTSLHFGTRETDYNPKNPFRTINLFESWIIHTQIVSIRFSSFGIWQCDFNTLQICNLSIKFVSNYLQFLPLQPVSWLTHIPITQISLLTFGIVAKLAQTKYADNFSLRCVFRLRWTKIKIAACPCIVQLCMSLALITIHIQQRVQYIAYSVSFSFNANHIISTECQYNIPRTNVLYLLTSPLHFSLRHRIFMFRLDCYA